jgi:hypothetical protein
MVCVETEKEYMHINNVGSSPVFNSGKTGLAKNAPEAAKDEGNQAIHCKSCKAASAGKGEKIDIDA